ncbi:unnamed protein product [Heligmosomoides polygyrus]|uniref:C2H2-type domain-containing protein n=1 Tax=Heligmosomoides polygyrus TaxID=6339 RepID=A0A183GXA2_HELPZ|nr:unnamed protein product [Heligmosomoides polygyrus]
MVTLRSKNFMNCPLCGIQLADYVDFVEHCSDIHDDHDSEDIHGDQENVYKGYTIVEEQFENKDEYEVAFEQFSSK